MRNNNRIVGGGEGGGRRRRRENKRVYAGKKINYHAQHSKVNKNKIWFLLQPNNQTKPS